MWLVALVAYDVFVEWFVVTGASLVICKQLNSGGVFCGRHRPKILKMADVSKAQKLASARKKFKELKKEKKKNAEHKSEENPTSTQPSREQTPVDSITFQTNTTTTTATDNQVENTQIPNFFSNSSYSYNYQQPAEFFDNFQINTTSVEQPPGAIFSADGNVLPTSSYFSNNGAIQNNYNYENNENARIKTPIEYEEKEQVPLKVDDFFEKSSASIVTEKEQSPAYNTVNFDQTPEYSSVESLKQLSNQMAELIRPNTEIPVSSLETELEKRNQELAALLTKEKNKSDHLTTILDEYKNRIEELTIEVKQKEQGTDNKFEQETGRLRDELQTHIQTVGILVAEKTELSANLSQFQLTAKQKTAECEELQARLKASRSRVADLERERNLLKNEQLQNDNLGKSHSDELEKMQQLYTILKGEKDDLFQELLEVREKLKNSSEANLVLQQHLGELSNQVSMANIKIQQLTMGEFDQNNGQLEQITQEKFALEKQVVELNQLIKNLTKDRDESNIQYQQYAQQLNAQLSNLAGKLEQLQKENESLSLQEQNRIKHISDLEKQLQNLQNDQIAFATQKKNSGETRAEREAAVELIENLQSKNSELQEENEKAVHERELLSLNLAEKDVDIKKLESLVEELKGSQPDNAKLLAVMESDKVAAARAVSQNSEMKKQMESLQEVFLKLNTDKVELTEKLTTEQRSNKDIFEKLQKTELHLQTLADAIEIKDKELSHLRESSEELNKHLVQTEQLTDRLRHYEAHDHSSHALQNELQEAKLVISKLTEEINRLQQRKDERPQETSSDDLSELRQKLETLERRNQELELKLSNSDDVNVVVNGSREENEIKSNDDTHDSNWNVLDKESAMKHLEQKFLRTMEEIANLTEEKQRLEHLVLQLQSETETIGEYVALYQTQRSILKQKAVEKDQQLTQLASDREQIKTKLEQLNQLVRKLVIEKGAIPQELLDHQETISQGQDLCEEHAKIHDEINKITQNSLIIESCDNRLKRSETAEQIITLLSEIKTSNLVQPSDENFHHCPWCSGQLITV